MAANETAGVVGNKGLSSSKEEYIAALLREKQLDHVNQVSDPGTPRDGLYVRVGKRTLDVIISLAALIVSSPVNLILGICTFFDVGRPIFFKQTRMGKDGTRFEIVKFRNMTNATDENGVLLPPSQRVTKFGKFVRKVSLDELLNFWSVLKGDMSIIGPRPLPVIFEDRYSDRHKMRFAVKPGLECPRVIHVDELAEHQEQGGMSKYQAQFENDVWYVEHVSFATDCRMILKLFQMTFNFKKRTKAAGGNSYFVGYDEYDRAISFKKICEFHPEYLDGYESGEERKERTAV